MCSMSNQHIRRIHHTQQHCYPPLSSPPGVHHAAALCGAPSTTLDSYSSGLCPSTTSVHIHQTNHIHEIQHTLQYAYHTRSPHMVVFVLCSFTTSITYSSPAAVPVSQCNSCCSGRVPFLRPLIIPYSPTFAYLAVPCDMVLWGMLCFEALSCLYIIRSSCRAKLAVACAALQMVDLC
jgi:hypothetical protein